MEPFLEYFYFQYFIHRRLHFLTCIQPPPGYHEPTWDGLVIVRTETLHEGGEDLD